MMIHIYQLNTEGAASEELEEEDDISAANHWILPSSNNNKISTISATNIKLFDVILFTEAVVCHL